MDTITVLYIPEGPSRPYLWLLVPKMDTKSYNRGYLEPEGMGTRTMQVSNEPPKRKLNPAAIPQRRELQLTTTENYR